MYLNIINNFNHKSKSKSKKKDYSLEEEKNNSEIEISQITEDAPDFLYYSVFYGDLTNNWINLKH